MYEESSWLHETGSTWEAPATHPSTGPSTCTGSCTGSCGLRCKWATTPSRLRQGPSSEPRNRHPDCPCPCPQRPAQAFHPWLHPGSTSTPCLSVSSAVKSWVMASCSSGNYPDSASSISSSVFTPDLVDIATHLVIQKLRVCLRNLPIWSLTSLGHCMYRSCSLTWFFCVFIKSALYITLMMIIWGRLEPRSPLEVELNCNDNTIECLDWCRRRVFTDCIF